MKTSFSILAIVSLITWSGANDVQEFSEDVLLSRDLWNTDSSALSAEFINSNIDLELVVSAHPDDDTQFALDASSIPNQERAFDHPVCHKYHGITIDGSETYCRIKWFEFYVSRDSNPYVPTYIHIVMFSTPRPETNRALFFIGHILKIPAAYASGNTTQELRDWARTARVGISYPATFEQLENIIQTHRLTINFEWLNEVLEFGVRPSQRNSDPAHRENVYYFRPFVLPDIIIDKILEVDDYLRDLFESRRTRGLSNGNGHIELSHIAN